MSYHIFCTDPSLFPSQPYHTLTLKHSQITIHTFISSQQEPFLHKLRHHHTQHHSWAIMPQDVTLKAAFFDMDGTVISGESLVMLAHKCLTRPVQEEIALITEKAMNGSIAFVPALQEKMAHLRGTEASELSRLSDDITLNPGIEEWINMLSQQNVPSYLVTGGLKAQAVPVAQKLKMQGICANSAEWINVAAKDTDPPQWELTGRLTGKIIDGPAKAQFLQDTCSALGCDPKNTLAVGDGSNDQYIAQAAGLAIGFHPKPTLVAHLDGVNRTPTHLFISDLLAYLRSPA